MLFFFFPNSFKFVPALHALKELTYLLPSHQPFLAPFSFLTLCWVGIFCQFATKCGVAIIRVRSQEVGRWRPHCDAGWLDLWGRGRLESPLVLKSPPSTLSFQQEQLKEVCHFLPLFFTVEQQILEASEAKFRPVIAELGSHYKEK